MDKEKRPNKKIKDVLTYAYIRRVKKWMFCPACQNGKMTINKSSTMWTCEECGYKLSADEFEDNYVFWFCDECNTYLNNQENFNRTLNKHICQNCGYENDTTLNNVKGICSDCGKTLPNADATLCMECKKVRKEKAKEWMIYGAKVVGVAAFVGAVTYLTEQATDENESGVIVKKSWLKTASEDELRAKKAEIASDTDWHSGSILDGDFDDEIEALDAIDEEINQRAWDRYNSEEHSNESYGVHREHGWYLPNDD